MERKIELPVVNKKNQYGRIYSIIAVLLGIVLFAFSVFIGNSNKEENIIRLDDSVITKVVEENNDDNIYYELTFSDNTNSYRIKKEDNFTLEVGEIIDVICSPKLFSENEFFIVELTKNNEVVYSIIDYNRNSAKVLFFISLPLMLGGTTIFVILLKKNNDNKMKEYSLYEIYAKIPYGNLLNESYKKENKQLKLLCIGQLVALVVGIPLIVVGCSVFENNLPILLLLVIGGASITLLYSLGLILFAFFSKSGMRNKKGRIKDFVHKLDEYYQSEVTKEDEAFIESGFYTPEGEEGEARRIIPYDKMNFFVEVQYNNEREMARIIIFSDFSESDNEDGEYFALLTKETLHAIRKYNVHVRGLDYILSHLEEELYKHNTKFFKDGYKIVAYKDEQF